MKLAIILRLSRAILRLSRTILRLSRTILRLSGTMVRCYQSHRVAIILGKRRLWTGETEIAAGRKRRYYKLSQCHNIGRLNNYVVV